MPFQRVPNTARFDFVMDFVPVAGEAIEAMCSVYIQQDALFAPWSVATLTAVAEAQAGIFSAFFGPFASNRWTFDRVEARDLDVEFGATATVEANTPGVGVNQAYSSAIAVLVTKIGGPTGPPRRGRVFQPGLAENQVEGNLVLQAAVDDVAEGWDTLRGGAVGASTEPVIVSRYARQFVTAQNPRGLRPVAEVNVWESTSARALVATQRDRRAD